ncbi:MAG TPA: CcmD family protein [Bacteroidetes bacterium]|jgi:hypothetical protein|nr:MAG: hypothetical protein ABR94_06960 [Sphingobacteriales bacterium BACL12 MAG-120802-bin5]KRP11743.1 MAG: hypothetical protein ABR95_03265 [Sphingobacteriales bacterium BACL12 MAG-120813-bin55]HCK23144.1 CcmD family protein [Bacteroidota bacterium]
MKAFYKALFSIIAITLVSPVAALAQEASGQPEMATGMRSNGLIFVVVGVIVIILGGLFLFLIRIDRKLNKMEREIDNKS